jgi:hypothetical protein
MKVYCNIYRENCYFKRTAGERKECSCYTDGAKRQGFLPSIHKVTPHHFKKNKMRTKHSIFFFFLLLPHLTHTTCWFLSFFLLLLQFSLTSRLISFFFFFFFFLLLLQFSLTYPATALTISGNVLHFRPTQPENGKTQIQPQKSILMPQKPFLMP